MPSPDYDAWFFDLGGTLVEIEDDEIAHGPDGRVVPLPGALEALERLRGARKLLELCLLSRPTATSRKTLASATIVIRAFGA